MLVGRPFIGNLTAHCIKKIMLPKSLDGDSAEQSPVPWMAKALFNGLEWWLLPLYNSGPGLVLVGFGQECRVN